MLSLKIGATPCRVTCTTRRRNTFNPADYGTVALWLKADSLALEDEDVVDTWPDSSGNGNDATQATFSKMPLYIADAINGHPAVQGDGVDDALSLTSLSALTSGAIFAVIKADGTSGATSGLWKLGNADDPKTFYGFGGNVVYEAFGTTARKDNLAIGTSVTQWNIYSVTSAPGDWRAYINGAQFHQTTSNSVAFPSDPLVFWNGVTPFGGRVAEIIIFSGVPNAGGRAAVHQYLSTKYGTTLS